jgi:hypothetical protein
MPKGAKQAPPQQSTLGEMWGGKKKNNTKKKEVESDGAAFNSAFTRLVAR